MYRTHLELGAKLLSPNALALPRARVRRRALDRHLPRDRGVELLLRVRLRVALRADSLREPALPRVVVLLREEAAVALPVVDANLPECPSARRTPSRAPRAGPRTRSRCAPWRRGGRGGGGGRRCRGACLAARGGGVTAREQPTRTMIVRRARSAVTSACVSTKTQTERTGRCARAARQNRDAPRRMARLAEDAARRRGRPAAPPFGAMSVANFFATTLNPASGGGVGSAWTRPHQSHPTASNNNGGNGTGDGPLDALVSSSSARPTRERDAHSRARRLRRGRLRRRRARRRAPRPHPRAARGVRRRRIRGGGARGVVLAAGSRGEVRDPGAADATDGRRRGRGSRASSTA